MLGEILLVLTGFIPEYTPSDLDTTKQKFIPIGYYKDNEPVCMRKIYLKDDKVVNVVDCKP